MSTTENAHAVGGSASDAGSATSPDPPPRGTSATLRRYVWWIVALGVIAASVGVVVWARSRPGYDPFGWMIWGYQALHGSLDLGGAPSWKPMPLLFTLPFALFGHFQLSLWMTAAYAMSFAGCVFAARIAFRVVDEHGRHRWPAIAAAAFAFVLPLCIYDSTHYSYLHYVFSAQSDPPLVSAVLMAIDMALLGRKRWAVAALTFAGLGRPEAWPALLLYSLWCLRQEREILPFLIACAAITLFMWFGIPWITNNKPLIAGDLAAGSPRMLHSNKIIGTIARYRALNLWPVWLCAGLGSAWAAFGVWRGRDEHRRRDLFILALFGNCVLWVVVEIAFSLKGLPGVPRYMFEPGVVAIVIAAIFVGQLLQEIPRFLRAPRAIGLVLAVAIVALIVPGALSRLRSEHRDLNGQHPRTVEINRLQTFVEHLGGLRGIESCGKPVLNVEYVSIFGWLTHLNTGQVGYKANWELHQPYPTVLITPLPNGWAAYPWHTRSTDVARCDARDKVLYIFTRHHPNGVTVPNRVPPHLTPVRNGH